MSQYTLKLLQLVDYAENQLTVRLTIGTESYDYTISISDWTYQSIRQSLNGEIDYLCRLSFITKRDPFNDSYVSSMTLINEKDKHQINFNCDESYVQLLEAIRKAPSFEAINEIAGIQLKSDLENQALADSANNTTVTKEKPAHEDKIEEANEQVHLNNEIEAPSKIAAKQELTEVFASDFEDTNELRIEENDDIHKTKNKQNQSLLIEEDKSSSQQSNVEVITRNKKRRLYLNRLKNSLIAAVAIIAIVIFSGDYFFANESEKLEIGQGTELLAPSGNNEDTDSNDGERPSENNEEAGLSDEELSQENSGESLAESNSEDEENDTTENDETDSSSVESEAMFYEVDDVAYSLPEGYVALTFDDGPSVYTKQIVDLLNEYDAPATFFFVGDHVNKYTDEVVYTSEQGHLIASHTNSHKNITKLSGAALDREIFDSIQQLEELTGETINLFRPPYGAISSNNKLLLSENNIKTVMWNRDPRDWEARSKDDILNYFFDVDPSGGIYILHENKYTLEALPEILAYLNELGLDIVGIK